MIYVLSYSIVLLLEAWIKNGEFALLLISSNCCIDSHIRICLYREFLSMLSSKTLSFIYDKN